jgi:hypothetical protein
MVVIRMAKRFIAGTSELTGECTDMLRMLKLNVMRASRPTFAYRVYGAESTVSLKPWAAY